MRARATPDFTSPHVPLALLGAALVWTTSIAGSGFSLLSLPFALWSTMPYGGLWIVGRMAPRPWPILGAGAAAIAADLGIRASVFLWPRGSTAAIALVFSPAYITTFIMPIGAAVGWLFGTMWRWHLAGRIVTVTVGPLVLGLLTLGLARPELFPTTDRRFGSANRLRRDLRSLSACDRREARRWLGRGLRPRRDRAAAPASPVTRYSGAGS